MKHIRVLALTGTLLLAGSLVLAPPASAESSKTSVDVYEVVCVEWPGIQWIAGNTLHIRGQENHNNFYDPDTFEHLGENWVVANANVNRTTGEWHFFGTFSGLYFPESDIDTFDGTWNAEQSHEGGFFGRAVGQGTGELHGKKIKLSLRGVDPSEVPQLWPPDCEMPAGVFRDTGFVHSRGGN